MLRGVIRSATGRHVVSGVFGLLFVFGAGVLLSGCEPPPPCTHQWVGPANGDFAVAANWDTGTVPGAASVACAPESSVIEIRDQRTVRRVGLFKSTLHVTAPGSLTTTSASNSTYLTVDGAMNSTFTAAFLEVGGSATFSGNSVVAGSNQVTVTGTPKLRDRARLWSDKRAILDHATIQVCDDATVRIEGTDLSTAASITTAGCGAVGSASIQSTANWLHDGVLTSDLPVIARGCRTDLRGTLTAPSYRQVAGAVCSADAPMATFVSPTSVLTFDVLHLDAGRLAGTGTVKADVDGAGTVAPGVDIYSFPTLTIDGDYTPSAGAHLAVDVHFSGTPGTDALRVTGTATLTNLTVSTSLSPNQAQPVIGVSFKPLLFGSRIGSFAGVEKPPGTIPSWVPSYVADGAVLTTGKGVPDLTWPAPGAILAGTPLGATQLNATSSAAGTFVYSPAPGTVLAAGSNRTLSVAFHPTDTTTFVDATASVLINVTATAPTVTWANPAAIVKWTPLSATQLNATASVPGSFFYSPGLGTVLDVGAARPLSVLFVPTDRATYPTVAKTVTIAVTAPPTLNTFRTQTETPGRFDAPLAVDLDGDGRADVVGTHTGASHISVLLRKTAGAFAAPTTYAVGSYPRSVEAADLNGDGRPDLVVQNNDSSVSVLLGTGGGVFAPSVRVPIGGSPSGMALGDLNGDGRVDVALGVYNTVKVLWGDGSGAFGASTTLPLPFGFLGTVRVADLNADGRRDIVVLGYPGKLVVLMNSGSGTFAAPTQLTVPGDYGSVTVGDVTGDAKPDLVTGTDGSISVFPGNGDGTFGANADYAIAGYARSISIGDLDGDARADVAVTDSSHGVFLVFRSLPAGTLAAPTSYPFNSGQSPEAGTIGDIDGDHRPDLVGANGAYSSDPGVLSVLLGATASTLTWSAPAPISVGTPLGATQLNAVASVPGTITYSPPSGTVLPVGESLLTATFTPTDIVTYAATTAKVPLVVTGPGGFNGRSEIASGYPNWTILTRDIDGDGDLDLISSQYSPYAFSVRLGTGTGAFGAPTLYPLSGWPKDLDLADLNGDAKLDLVVLNYNTVSIYLGTGTGAFTAGTGRSFASQIGSLAIGDVNGDTRQDLVMTNYDNAQILVMFGDGAGGTSALGTYSALSQPGELSVADLNGDGRADVVVKNASVYSVMLGTPSGLGASVSGPIVASLSRSVLADATSDGKLDLIWISEVGNNRIVSVAPGTGLGTFDWAHVTTSTIATVTDFYDDATSIVAADRNRDGKVDLTFLNAGTDTVGMVVGSGAGTFGPTGSFAIPDGATSLAIGDLNGDNKLDAVIGYTSTPSMSILTGT